MGVESEVPPKIQIFVWKVVRGILPTRAALRRRGMDVDSSCVRCGFHSETIEHVLRDCSWTEFMWATSPLRLQPMDARERGDITEWIEHVMTNGEKESQSLFAILMWMAWHARNMKIFQQKEIQHQWCIRTALKMHDEQVKAAERERSRNFPRAADVWQKPDAPWVKINTDASIVGGVGTGLGAIVRNSEGQHLNSLVQFRPEEMEVDIAEALACKEGGISDFALDLASGRFELRLLYPSPCDAKFETHVRYQCNITGSVSYGKIANLSGVAAQELFLWLSVKAIEVDVPSSGLIYFDVGVVFKQFSLSFFETPKDCDALKGGDRGDDVVVLFDDRRLHRDRGRIVENHPEEFVRKSLTDDEQRAVS
ncbi:hypothetical protein DH2020_029868 [Rehmannia glutinosa]|uniref:Reverse transcriptase zinc-binding domain-containing protein n=1 Tax=Rehmannia glutinosa TaxID=99300 RepID=A0ABR0VMF8_REHGL